MVNENELWYVIGFVGFILWGLVINMALDDAEIEEEIDKANIQDKDVDDGGE